MRVLLVGVVAACAIACGKREVDDGNVTAEAAWRRVEELAAPLSKPGPTESLDEARKVARVHNWAGNRRYPEMENVLRLLRDWAAEEGGIRTTGAQASSGIALEYRNLLHPVVKSTRDPAVLGIVETIGKRFLEQGTSLVDGTVGVMIQREVAVRSKELGLPHKVDVALWTKGSVRIIATEAVAIQAARSDPARPKPSPESVLDAEANLAALTAVLGNATLETDWDTLLAKLRAAPAQRPATKALLADLIEMVESDRKLAAELSR